MVDCHDLAHMGFSAFNHLLDKYQPALFLHGHTHLNYGHTIQRESTYGTTRVVNVPAQAARVLKAAGLDKLMHFS